MKIIKLEAENLKKIRAVEITPDGAVVQITGANGSGKSSVLDAIWYALAGKSNIPSEPIRHGEETARVRLDLGEIVVTRKFSDAGSNLTVETPEGAAYPSPQRLLDGLLGSLTFDPLAFARMTPKAQLETLRGLVPLDTDVGALDALNVADYDRRTEWNRTVRSLEERAKALSESLHPDMDATPVDVAALVATMNDAIARNTGLRDEAMQRRERQSRADAQADQLRAIDAEIQQLTARRADLAEFTQTEAAAIAALPPLPEPTDTTAIAGEITTGQAENLRRQTERQQREALVKIGTDLKAATVESERLTAAIDTRTAEKQAAIARATMPVPGLSFGEGEVVFNDVPLAQASTAEQLRVSVAIGMAAKPRLRVLRIQEGSLLDENSLSMIADMAETAGYQCWIESVDTSGRVGIYLEDGAIVAVNGVPVQESEPVAA